MIDLGCGHGLFTFLAAIQGPERKILGQDHDASRIKQAQGAHKGQTNVEFAVRDIEDLGSETLDAITMIDALHDLPDARQRLLLRQIYAQLNEGGTLLIREIDQGNGLIAKFNQFYETLAVRFGVTKANEVYLRSSTEWVEVFEETGFTVVPEPCRSLFFADVLFICRKPDGKESLSRYQPRPIMLMTADDWGMSPGINAGILELARLGIVRRVSVLADAPYVETHLAELKETSHIELGLHFALTYSSPNKKEKNLGSLKKFFQFLVHPFESIASKRQLFRQEFQRQVTRLEEYGVKPTYIDGHHHVHAFPIVAPTVAVEAKKANIQWVRLPFDPSLWFSSKFWLNALALIAKRSFQQEGLKFYPFIYPQLTSYQYPLKLANKLRDSYYQKLIESGDLHSSFEVIVHPAAKDDLAEIGCHDPYQRQRVIEFRTLKRLPLAQNIVAEIQEPPRINPLSQMPSFQFMMTSSVMVILWHLIYASFLIDVKNLDWVRVLTNWDAGWFNRIIHYGYAKQSWAFYPLYPILVEAFAWCWGWVHQPQIAGTVFSVFCFLLVCWIFARKTIQYQKKSSPLGLTPKTRLAWIFLLLSPASYALHTHHTEALFLLLSASALLLCQDRKWIAAALLGGLCALTKNQGVFLSLAVAIWASIDANSMKLKIKRFVGLGILSGSMFSLYPLYQYLIAGDPLLFVKAQEYWHDDISFESWIQTFFLDNPWQNTSFGSIQNYVLFFTLLFAGFFLLFRQSALGLYVILFVGIESVAGELVGTRRYASVLFPALFILGDVTAKRVPRKLQWLIFLLLIWLNTAVLRSYLLGRWAY